jgi:cold shock CspA family protein/ribosome-associated translation inhibitor RaiA
MLVAPEITFRSFEPTDRIRARIDKEVETLNTHFPRIASCKVMVQGGARRHTGDLAHVTLHITLPGGKDVAVSSMKDDAGARSDVMVAIRDAFKAAERQLKSYKPDPRAEGAQASRLSGTVARFLAGEPAGFIAGEDGTDYYLHAREVTGAKFDELVIGDAVTFRPEPGDKGPMARAVHTRGN